MSVLIANKKKAKRRKLKKDINLECDKKYNLGSSVDIEEEKKKLDQIFQLFLLCSSEQ